MSRQCVICASPIAPERVKRGGWATCSKECAKKHNKNNFKRMHDESRRERAERKLDKWRDVAAYLLDRADQYETKSPCWVALADAAEALMNGEVEGAVVHGEFDEALYARVDGMRREKT